MKIAFCSNIFCHHQKPLSDEVYKLNNKYKFIENEPFLEERKKMKWDNKKANYVINTVNNKENQKIVKK